MMINQMFDDIIRLSLYIQFSSGVRFLWEKDDQQQCAPVTREHMSLSGSNSTHWDVVRAFASYTAQTAEMMQFHRVQLEAARRHWRAHTRKAALLH